MKLLFRIFQVCNLVLTLALLEEYVFKHSIHVLSVHTLSLTLPIFIMVRILMASDWSSVSMTAWIANAVSWILHRRTLRYMQYRFYEMLQKIPSNAMIRDPSFTARFERLITGDYRYVLTLGKTSRPAVEKIIHPCAAYEEYWALARTFYEGTQYKIFCSTLLRLLLSPFNLGQAIQQQLRDPLLWLEAKNQLLARVPAFIMLSVPIAWFILARRQFGQARQAM